MRNYNLKEFSERSQFIRDAIQEERDKWIEIFPNNPNNNYENATIRNDIYNLFYEIENELCKMNIKQGA